MAHRLSTVEDADEIVVLEGGRIVERGSHDVLLARQGLYRQLYNATPDSLPAEKDPVHAPKDRG
jgi:ATP-binding cassette subfamily B protein